MTTPFEQLAGLDRLIHDPTRLAILSALEACAEADFLFLQSLTGLTRGNLSSHLSKLEEAGWVAIDKRFEGKRPVTRAAITAAGRRALVEHWERLDTLRDRARSWQPAD